MESEKQVAKENVSRRGMSIDIQGICIGNVQTLQRWLEFLEAMKGRQQKWLTYQLIPMNDKIQDIKDALKIYQQNGITS